MELVRSARERLPLLVDQGRSDEFLATQLRPELLNKVFDQVGQPGPLHAVYLGSLYAYKQPHCRRQASRDLCCLPTDWHRVGTCIAQAVPWIHGLWPHILTSS